MYLVTSDIVILSTIWRRSVALCLIKLINPNSLRPPLDSLEVGGGCVEILQFTI